MLKNITPILCLFLITLALAACGSTAAARPETTTNQTESKPAANSTTNQTIGDPAAGQELFTGSCAACHGPAGEGMPGLGKDITTSEFVAGLTDQELVEFIKVGRDPSDPLNTTGVGMPAKGGNPALSDEKLYDIAAYIRALHK